MDREQLLTCLQCDDALVLDAQYDISRMTNQSYIVACDTCNQLHIIEKNSMRLIQNTYS